MRATRALRAGPVMIVVCAAAACGWWAQGALAQDGAGPGASDEPSAPVLRAMIERRLELLDEQRERLAAIARRLDAGEAPADVLADLRERGRVRQLLGDMRGSFRDGPAAQGAGRGGAEGQRRRDRDDEPVFALARTRILAFLDEHMPELAARVRAEGDSPRAQRAVRRLWDEVRRLERLQASGSGEFGPALEQLRNGLRISELVQRIRRMASEDKLDRPTLRNARRELARLVEAQFEAQMRRREAFLDRAEQRAAQARQRLAEERAAKDERVRAEVAKLLREAIGARPGADAAGEPTTGESASGEPVPDGSGPG